MPSYPTRVTIQKPVNTRTSSGAASTTWVDYATVQVRIKPLEGREYMANKQAQGETTHEIKMRYLHGVRPSMRLKWGTSKPRYFDIESVINTRGRNRVLVLMCREDV